MSDKSQRLPVREKNNQILSGDNWQIAEEIKLSQ